MIWTWSAICFVNPPLPSWVGRRFWFWSPPHEAEWIQQSATAGRQLGGHQALVLQQWRPLKIWTKPVAIIQEQSKKVKATKPLSQRPAQRCNNTTKNPKPKTYTLNQEIMSENSEHERPLPCSWSSSVSSRTWSWPESHPLLRSAQILRNPPVMA